MKAPEGIETVFGCSLQQAMLDYDSRRVSLDIVMCEAARRDEHYEIKDSPVAHIPENFALGRDDHHGPQAWYLNKVDAKPNLAGNGDGGARIALACLRSYSSHRRDINCTLHEARARDNAVKLMDMPHIPSTTLSNGSIAVWNVWKATPCKWQRHFVFASLVHYNLQRVDIFHYLAQV